MHCLKSHRRFTSSNGRGRAVGILCWLAIVAAGMLALIDYSNLPGKTAAAAVAWPNDSGINRQEDRPTLLMFLHPHCPCSRASLHQLARLLTDSNRNVRVQFVMFCPHDKPESWTRTDLWDVCAKLSHVPPVIDRDGWEAAQFGATTSGHVLLFAATGERLYSGGITSSRAHEGDNLGCQTIQRLLEGKPVEHTEYPVYGCAILGDRETVKGQE